MMNSYYLDKENLKIISQEFKKTGLVRLDGFIEENLYENLKREIKNNKFVQDKIPDSHSFAESKNSPLTSQILATQEIKYIIENITNSKVKSVEVTTKKFRHRDYTIIKDEQQKKELEFIFFICESWDPNWGGNKVYVKGEHSLVFPPRGNSFVLTQKSKDTKDFLQYINHLAENREIILVEGKIK